jgi:hypothetical protein
MKKYHEEFPQDPLSELLRQIPLEAPPQNFTKKVMAQIPKIEVESKVYFYQKPIFISCIGIVFAACFLLFYKAEFSISLLLTQLENYYAFIYNYIISFNFIPRQITFSPIIVAPIVLIACIFIADKMMEAYKKQKQHQVFCI